MTTPGSGGLIDRLQPTVLRVVEGEGCELVELRFRGRILVVTIDRDAGVKLADCEAVSHQLSTVLDVEDVIPFSYTLEVSSPGIERPLKSERDFSRVVGRRLKVRYENGEPPCVAVIVGTLTAADGAGIVVDPSADRSRKQARQAPGPVRIRFEQIREARQEVDFRGR